MGFVFFTLIETFFFPEKHIIYLCKIILTNLAYLKYILNLNLAYL